MWSLFADFVILEVKKIWLIKNAKKKKKKKKNESNNNNNKKKRFRSNLMFSGVIRGTQYGHIERCMKL